MWFFTVSLFRIIIQIIGYHCALIYTSCVHITYSSSDVTIMYHVIYHKPLFFPKSSEYGLRGFHWCSVVKSTFFISWYITPYAKGAHFGCPYQQGFVYDMQINSAGFLLKDKVKHLSTLLCLIIMRLFTVHKSSVHLCANSQQSFQFQQFSPVILNLRCVFSSMLWKLFLLKSWFSMQYKPL